MPERYYFVLNYPANPVRLAGASNCIPAWVGLPPSPAPSVFYSAPSGFLFGLSFPVLFAAFKSKAKSRPFFTSIPQPKQVGLVFKPLLHPVLLDGLVLFFCTLFFVPIHFAWNQPCTCSPTCLYVMCLGFMVFNPTFRIPCFYCNPIPMPKMPVRPCPCRACKSAHQGRTFFVFFQKKLPHRWAVNPWHRKVYVRRSQPSTLWRYMGFAPVLQIAAQGRQIRALFYTPKGVLFDLTYPLSG